MDQYSDISHSRDPPSNPQYGRTNVETCLPTGLGQKTGNIPGNSSRASQEFGRANIIAAITIPRLRWPRTQRFSGSPADIQPRTWGPLQGGHPECKTWDVKGWVPCACRRLRHSNVSSADNSRWHWPPRIRELNACASRGGADDGPLSAAMRQGKVVLELSDPICRADLTRGGTQATQQRWSRV